ncbi:teichoic acid biosynthesis protein C [Histoplasma capsulatum G186AR]|uniref:Teichoic acid biosynthesis protein C n=2 Tax=Ajellomyces capsulatus TaxID=5037 RepID=C0NDU5_AJECG|nr:teichoic acid biosynthesis protein C [Histoplasma capsulatum G186AR]EEH10393.1 teichoic acid biosynthesis protein C [Histoplasma capsulatum G186AR]KAG5290628.1 teichoic acid biosynthesis protein C [Histoplasma capsulatum]QSS72556.1 teichoic acid biosynthesis protein C [Histoplasma capsulatum G186AR]
MRIPIHTALTFCWAHTTAPRSDPAAPSASTLRSPPTSRGDFSRPLVDSKQPPLDAFRSKVFQGYAAYGPHLYVPSGTSYDTSGGVVNSQVASIEMNTGKIVQGPTH